MVFEIAMILAASVVAVSVVTVLVAVLDILRRGDDDWDRTGESRIAWLVVSILGGVLGSVIYLVHARPKFVRPQVKAY